jgi:hypothetical protein
MNQLDLVMNRAERELAAFLRAVKELFGPEQAELAVEDWLQEFVAISGQPVATREWRRVTVNAARRLAGRLGISTASH